MKTTILINELPVEFSDQKPTRPGACWRIKREGRFTCGSYITHVDKGLRTGRLVDNAGDGASYIDDLFDDGWRFSAPLVPVTEVEKAWNEAREDDPDDPDCFAFAWEDSNARKVVEGLS